MRNDDGLGSSLEGSRKGPERKQDEEKRIRLYHRLSCRMSLHEFNVLLSPDIDS